MQKKTKPKSGPNAKDPNSRTQQILARRTAANLSPEAKRRRDVYVDALIRGHTKKEAALMAGFTEQSAQKQGSLLWCEPYVQEQYRKLRDSVEEEQIVTRKDVIIGLVQEARHDGPKSVHIARVAAWTQVAKVMGFEAPVKSEVSLQHNVMVVPMADSAADWEANASTSQKKLKDAIRS